MQANNRHEEIQFKNSQIRDSPSTFMSRYRHPRKVSYSSEDSARSNNRKAHVVELSDSDTMELQRSRSVPRMGRQAYRQNSNGDGRGEANYRQNNSSDREQGPRRVRDIKGELHYTQNHKWIPNKGQNSFDNRKGGQNYRENSFDNRKGGQNYGENSFDNRKGGQNYRENRFDNRKVEQNYRENSFDNRKGGQKNSLNNSKQMQSQRQNREVQHYRQNSLENSRVTQNGRQNSTKPSKGKTTYTQTRTTTEEQTVTARLPQEKRYVSVLTAQLKPPVHPNKASPERRGLRRQKDITGDSLQNQAFRRQASLPLELSRGQNKNPLLNSRYPKAPESERPSRKTFFQRPESNRSSTTSTQGKLHVSLFPDQVRARSVSPRPTHGAYIIRDDNNTRCTSILMSPKAYSEAGHNLRPQFPDLKPLHRSRSLDQFSTTLEIRDNSPGVVHFNQRRTLPEDPTHFSRSVSERQVLRKPRSRVLRPEGQLTRKISVNQDENYVPAYGKNVRELRHRFVPEDANKLEYQSNTERSPQPLKLHKDLSREESWESQRHALLSPTSSGYSSADQLSARQSSVKSPEALLRAPSRSPHTKLKRVSNPSAQATYAPRIMIENEVNGKHKRWVSLPVDMKSRDMSTNMPVNINIHNHVAPDHTGRGSRVRQDISVDGVPLAPRMDDRRAAKIENDGKMILSPQHEAHMLSRGTLKPHGSDHSAHGGNSKSGQNTSYRGQDDNRPMFSRERLSSPVKRLPRNNQQHTYTQPQHRSQQPHQSDGFPQQKVQSREQRDNVSHARKLHVKSGHSEVYV